MMPRFAEPILKARKAGMRPAAMVLVSDGIRNLYTRYPDNPTVVVDPDVLARDYDFRFLTGLEVEVFTEGPDRRGQALAFEIAKVVPDYLRVTFADTGAMWRIVQFGQWNVRRENDWVCRQ